MKTTYGLMPCLCLISFGCGPWIPLLMYYRMDVSDDSNYWGGYEHREKYTLMKDMYLCPASEVDEHLKISSIKFHPIGPRIAWDKPTKKYDEIISAYSGEEGLLATGTRLEIHEFIKFGAPGIGTGVRVYARVLDGPYQGIVAEVTQISKRLPLEDESGPRLYCPDPSLFQPSQ